MRDFSTSYVLSPVRNRHPVNYKRVIGWVWCADPLFNPGTDCFPQGKRFNLYSKIWLDINYLFLALWAENTVTGVGSLATRQPLRQVSSQAGYFLIQKSASDLHSQNGNLQVCENKISYNMNNQDELL